MKNTETKRQDASTYKMRPYQEEAIDAISKKWDDGDKRTLLVLPTGTGKTIVFANVAKHFTDKGEKVLILAHTGELLTQAINKVQEITGITPELEKAEAHASEEAQIVVASMQSLGREARLSRFDEDHFSLVIIDEAHHAMAENYQRIFKHFSDAKVLGVTATAERSDKKNLGSFFESLAYEYNLRQAVEDGYLVPLEAMTIPLNIDISNVKMSQGDYQAGELGHALEPYLEQIATEMEKVCKKRKTVVFVPLVSIAEKFRDILNKHGFKAFEVDGKSKDRTELLADFDSGKYNVVVNAMLLTEGWDCPPVDCTVVLRPTRSSGLYRQMIGRGTRLYPHKENLLILDFLWQTYEHDLCHPVDLVTDDEEIKERIQKKQNATGYANLDLLAEVNQTKRSLADELLRKLQEGQAKVSRKINPLTLGLMLNRDDIAYYEPFSYSERTHLVTKNQLDALRNLGLDDVSDVETSTQANQLISILIARKVDHLATPKQLRRLNAFGYKQAEEWNFAEASFIMQKFADNGWSIPTGEYSPTVYLPERLRRKNKRKRA